MIDDRKKRILQAIIEEYINTAEPVSSSSIMQNYGLQCSSATIRNEMSELENIGLLDKPHTSAGRVPSAKGYRFYVDELLKDDNISLDEISYIKSKLQTKVNEIEELTKIATNTLSDIMSFSIKRFAVSLFLSANSLNLLINSSVSSETQMYLPEPRLTGV